MNKNVLDNPKIYDAHIEMFKYLRDEYDESKISVVDVNEHYIIYQIEHEEEEYSYRVEAYFKGNCVQVTMSCGYLSQSDFAEFTDENTIVNCFVSADIMLRELMSGNYDDVISFKGIRFYREGKEIISKF